MDIKCSETLLRQAEVLNKELLALATEDNSTGSNNLLSGQVLYNTTCNLIPE